MLGDGGAPVVQGFLEILDYLIVGRPAFAMGEFEYQGIIRATGGEQRVQHLIGEDLAVGVVVGGEGVMAALVFERLLEMDHRGFGG